MTGTNSCRGCGTAVSRQFARVFGNNDDVVSACLECETNSGLFHGAASDPAIARSGSATPLRGPHATASDDPDPPQPLADGGDDPTPDVDAADDCCPACGEELPSEALREALPSVTHLTRTPGSRGQNRERSADVLTVVECDCGAAVELAVSVAVGAPGADTFDIDVSTALADGPIDSGEDP